MIRIPVSSAAFCTQMRCSRRKQKCDPLDLQWNFFLFSLYSQRAHLFSLIIPLWLTLIKFNVYFCKSLCNAILVGIRVEDETPNWSKGLAWIFQIALRIRVTATAAAAAAAAVASAASAILISNHHHTDGYITLIWILLKCLHWM